ncbi:MAG: hypothetical protein PVI90_18675 [Desulfobacteraceae bacterium]|jgi:hypothetical protein
MATNIDKKRWWQEDWTMELGLIILGIVGSLAIWKLGATDGKTIAVATITGIAGVLTGKKLNGNGGAG